MAGSLVAVLGALPDGLDADALVARHEAAGAAVTVVAQPVVEVAGRVLVLAGGDGRVMGVQVDPHPAEALSGLAAVAVVLSPAVRDHLPAGELDWGREALPALLEQGVDVYVDIVASP